ncbi:MAG: SDR family NAD(P)-dependent oxidoreductase, partial [Acidobacteriaceae bacterium]|nr:SDR family NAD(P)-dependent oxidoreductase [Acidobacteriaceae bacterium]
AASNGEDSIREKVLAIVAEKTGYPKEMLDLDLDLEADLGIDTVKQAEMLAAIRGAYNIPRDENLKLRDFPTLAHVIKFAQERSRIAKGPAPETTTTVKPISERPVAASLEAAERIPRRVPIPVLRPTLNLCKPTGVTLDSTRRVIVMPDKGGVAENLVKRLKAEGAQVLVLQNASTPEGLIETLQSWLKTGPVHGVYWLPALDDEGLLTKMDVEAWHQAVRLRVKNLYTTMRLVYEQIAPAGTFLVTASRLGGQHGYDTTGAVAPLGGAVVGFAKAYKRERSDALIKCLDFETGRNAEQIAEILINETLCDPGAVEIGYKNDLRWTVSLQEQPAADGQPGVTLDKNSVFVITGAAGSIVSAITADLAAASGGTFYLLDVVPEPDPNSPDLKRFGSDKENLKRDLFARIQARGERATPALVEKELVALERAAAAQAAIDAVHAAGGTAHYFSVNLTDADAVTEVIAQVRQRSGRIDVLLHAGGVERSHSLPDKEPREFDLVFDVKCDGFFNLLHAIGDMPLKASVVFTSVAGRFGNGGQTDYSAANDLLCKITSSFRTRRPDTRGIAIDWSAWGGIGMATRGSIPKMMELAGIDMLPPESGIPIVRRELTAGGTRGEVVIGQRLGVLLNEWDKSGGIDADASANLIPQGPMAAKIASAGVYNGITVETTLDPALQPFLHDHQIDRTPVLPGVMGLEAFAEAAQCLVSDWRIEAIENVTFIAPFKFYRNEPRTVNTNVVVSPCGTGVTADCKLIGSRALANQAEAQVTTHFTGRVRLTKEAAVATPALKVGTSGSVIEAADIYGLYFHGPAYQVLERAWWDGERVVGLMARGLRNNHHPAELQTLIAPRLVELCFQTAGLWEMGVRGRMGLPLHIDRVTFFRPEQDFKDVQLYAVVIPDASGESFTADVVDKEGNRYLHLDGYRTVEVPNALNPERLKALQNRMSAEAALAA